MTNPEVVERREKLIAATLDDRTLRAAPRFERPQHIQRLSRVAMGLDPLVDINAVPEGERQELLAVMGGARDVLVEADRQHQAQVLNMTENVRQSPESSTNSGAML